MRFVWPGTRSARAHVYEGGDAVFVSTRNAVTGEFTLVQTLLDGPVSPATLR